MRLFIIVILFSYTISSAQKITKEWDKMGMIKKSFEYDLIKTKRSSYVDVKDRGDNKGVFLEFDSDDSVSIYLNDSLIYSKRIKESQDHYVSFYPKLFTKIIKQKENYISILLNDRREYISFGLKKKYYIAKIYFRGNENTGYFWNVNYDNNLPSE